MVEKTVQTYVRAPNGDIYRVDGEGQAFRAADKPDDQRKPTDVFPTSTCQDMPDHVGAQIVPEADLPSPEGAHIVPDGTGAHAVPDHVGANIVPDGIGQQIIPEGFGQTIRP